MVLTPSRHLGAALHRLAPLRVGLALAATLALVASVAVSGCGAVPVGDVDGPTTVSARAPDSTEEYLPGLEADLYLPAGNPATSPVVVMVPGGGWTSADRAGLRPLATSLADAGAVVVNATYRVAPAATFPEPVADVVCAADFGAARSVRAGITPTRVVLLGHSAGAHLGALASLAPARFRAGCPWPPRDVDGFVGLAGPYGPELLATVAEPLFGTDPGADPERWREGTPGTWVGERGSKPAVLLVHGERDDVVPASQSRSLADALTHAGHPVELDLVSDADHQTIYAPGVAAARVTSWLASLD
jgi:acetyl esterase/lipase